MNQNFDIVDKKQMKNGTYEVINEKKIRECQSENRNHYLIREENINLVNGTFNYIGEQSIPNKCHIRGAKNSYDLYLCASVYRENDDVSEHFALIYDVSSHLMQHRFKLFANSGEKAECHFINDFEIICVTYTGFIYNYTITQELDNFRYSEFGHINKGEFRSAYCIETRNEHIIIGGWPNHSIHIFDKYGRWIRQTDTKYENIEISNRVYYITEILPNIIVTAELESGLYIHDLRNIEMDGHPITTSALLNPNTLQGAEYLVAVPLILSEEGIYFASGGRYHNKGFILVCELIYPDLMLTNCKEELDIPLVGCAIHFIRELEEGKIFFGGDSCSVICLWDYIGNNMAQCFKLDDNYDGMGGVTDIVSLCV